ncbi:type II toxin-antitoxin system VapC family toxin [Candidatus Venteria ishoeyi]|uniref:type II toxin-antitoxin system VapC family toxin n=1 Tax=Candidatus Venteria ishoeyi TaxID=1899563 RepID=UPI0025A66CC0|nr:type II toxin-antitoxin system VapC family toxin [Candidatus Venteria ishoeyi]MDM8546271.1 type II toxin-antitoxin system VapC family toxin [Candidatus Venteria ishoeyi]
MDEWLTDGVLVDSFAPYLQQPKDLIIPSVQQYELYRWVCRERDEATALDVIAITEQGTVITLDTGLALLAADMASQFKLAAMDAMIYSTAQQTGVELITSDRHFKDLPEVCYFSKAIS